MADNPISEFVARGGSIFATRFDVQSLSTTGGAVPVLDGRF